MVSLELKNKIDKLTGKKEFPAKNPDLQQQ